MTPGPPTPVVQGCAPLGTPVLQGPPALLGLCAGLAPTAPLVQGRALLALQGATAVPQASTTPPVTGAVTPGMPAQWDPPPGMQTCARRVGLLAVEQGSAPAAAQGMHVQPGRHRRRHLRTFVQLAGIAPLERRRAQTAAPALCARSKGPPVQPLPRVAWDSSATKGQQCAATVPVVDMVVRQQPPPVLAQVHVRQGISVPLGPQCPPTLLTSVPQDNTA